MHGAICVPAEMVPLHSMQPLSLTFPPRTLL